MPVKVKGQPIETKPAASLSTVAVVGYIVGLVFVLWPSLADKIPADYQQQLPNVIAVVIGAFVAYFVPHTNRPDLTTVEPFTEAEMEQIRYQMAQRQTVFGGGGGGASFIYGGGGVGGGSGEAGRDDTYPPSGGDGTPTE